MLTLFSHLLPISHAYGIQSVFRGLPRLRHHYGVLLRHRRSQPWIQTIATDTMPNPHSRHGFPRCLRHRLATCSFLQAAKLALRHRNHLFVVQQKLNSFLMGWFRRPPRLPVTTGIVAQRRVPLLVQGVRRRVAVILDAGWK